jgi:hypothetical protein
MLSGISVLGTFAFLHHTPKNLPGRPLHKIPTENGRSVIGRDLLDFTQANVSPMLPSELQAELADP